MVVEVPGGDPSSFAIEVIDAQGSRPVVGTPLSAAPSRTSDRPQPHGRRSGRVAPIHKIAVTLDKALPDIFASDYSERLESVRQRLRANAEDGDGATPPGSCRPATCEGGGSNEGSLCR